MAVALPIEFRDFTFAYAPNAVPALRELSLRLEAGSCTSVLGATGSGKTSSLYAIAGILGAHERGASASGSLTIGDQVHSPAPVEAQFPTVSMLLQEPHLQMSGMTETVHEEVVWTLANLAIDGAEAEARVRRILGSLGIPFLYDRHLRSLSGGELHRVALASVLVAEPSILLLDEPVSSLDQLARRAVVDLLRSLKRTMTIVLTDTEPDLALLVSDTIVVLDRGRMRFVGGTGDFLRTLESFAEILPVEQWSSALKAVQALDPTHPLRHRLTSIVEGL